MRGISTNLANNKKLTTLSISAIRLSSEDIIVLSKGIKESISLTSLSLNNISFMHNSTQCNAAFHKLACVLANHSSLESVELINDQLTDQYSSTIKMILTCQNNKRDTQVWMSSLRGSNVDSSAIHSIIKLNLSKNSFGDLFALTISEAMKNDTLLNCLNLSENNIGPNGMKCISAIMKYNKVLLSLDIRKNPGFSDMHFKKVAIGLLKNIISASKSHTKKTEIFDKNLVDRSLISIDVPEDILNSIISKTAKKHYSTSIDAKPKISESSTKCQVASSEGKTYSTQTNARERSTSSEKLIRHRRTNSISTPIPFSKTVNHSPKQACVNKEPIFSKRLSLPCSVNDQCNHCKILQKRVFLAESSALNCKMQMNLLKMRAESNGNKIKVCLKAKKLSREESCSDVRKKLDKMMVKMVGLLNILESGTE